MEEVSLQSSSPSSSSSSTNDEEASSSSRFSGVEKLREGDRFYKVVEKLFLGGMRRRSSAVNNAAAVRVDVVTSVQRCSYSARSMESRSKLFKAVADMTGEARGDANVRFAWYGASAEGVAEAVEHGFGKANGGGLGTGAHGLGVHLSPPHSPYGSSLLCRTNADGERHMVLCRVVLGNSERVEAGSLQCHPSSEEFDSGVDDLDNPRWYIIWSTHMNTHILPEYVVTFKTFSQPQGTKRAASTVKRPIATWLSFPRLLGEIGRSLPASKVQALMTFYDQYKEGKLSKDTFIRYIRSTVGDKLLASTIRRIRGN
ncbi:putative inactive poly [ADP-ribose] polymerase SRO3 [Iris pallida]|uniref:Inactive poly [ADP-ribose] polymerase SRO3 n=1 Tax=Iris pallida TaxID=29817 RepID=A0AAX6IG19_IRIPA|nr:putative inactive poly [ADP-ribose] polymerase SRO3 [Iris pallida]